MEISINKNQKLNAPPCISQLALDY